MASYNRAVVPDSLLLEAAFTSGPRACRAWEAWSRDRDLASLGPSELRLLPFVYQNLRDGAFDDAAIPPVVKEVARATFVRTRLLLRDAMSTVALFTANGIGAMLLKGAALVAGGYLAAGVRAMSDFDLLVDPADAPRAAALLESAGWRTDDRIERVIGFRHALLFRKTDHGCDLHWQVLMESDTSDAERAFWRDAESASLDAVAVRIPSSGHLLLHAILHGTRAFDRTTVRWIGDALAVLRTRGATLDWERFAEDAETRGVTYPTGDALAYLVEAFDAAVPANVIERLRAHPVSRLQRRLYLPRAGDARGEPTPYFRSLAYFALRRESGRLRWFVRNVQFSFGVTRLRRAPLELSRRALRRLTAKRNR